MYGNLTVLSNSALLGPMSYCLFVKSHFVYIVNYQSFSEKVLCHHSSVFLLFTILFCLCIRFLIFILPELVYFSCCFETISYSCSKSSCYIVLKYSINMSNIVLNTKCWYQLNFLCFEYARKYANVY